MGNDKCFSTIDPLIIGIHINHIGDFVIFQSFLQVNREGRPHGKLVFVLPLKRGAIDHQLNTVDAGFTKQFQWVMVAPVNRWHRINQGQLPLTTVADAGDDGIQIQQLQELRIGDARFIFLQIKIQAYRLADFNIIGQRCRHQLQIADHGNAVIGVHFCFDLPLPRYGLGDRY